MYVCILYVYLCMYVQYVLTPSVRRMYVSVYVCICILSRLECMWCVCCYRYLVDKVTPGTRVSVMGVSSLFNSGAQKKLQSSSSVRTPYLRVVGIQVRDETFHFHNTLPTAYLHTYIHTYIHTMSKYRNRLIEACSGVLKMIFSVYVCMYVCICMYVSAGGNGRKWTDRNAVLSGGRRRDASPRQRSGHIREARPLHRTTNIRSPRYKQCLMMDHSKLVCMYVCM